MSDGITWVGLDAHKQFINVAVRTPDSKDFVEWKGGLFTAALGC